MGNIRYKEDTPVGEISPLAIWYAKKNANVYGGGGPRRDKNYNTILTPEQEAKYREWVKTLPANLQSDYDYDLRGAWLVGDVPDENGHMTDYWKKPWHPTFSVESRYSSTETPGGEWHGEEFAPSWYNNVLDGYRRYWAGNEFAKGGPIHIKPENRGKFTAAANRAGKSVQAYASQILAHKDNYSPTLVKRANFARNAAKWHAAGGSLDGPDDPPGGFTLNIKSPMERFYSEQAEREKQGVMAADQTARQVPVVQAKPIAVKAVQENAATQGLIRNIAEVQAQQEGYTSAEEKEKTEAMAADLARIEANRGEIKPYDGSMRNSTDRTPNAGIFAASTPKENLRTATNLGMTAALFTPGVGLLASPYFFLRGANNFYQAGQDYGDGEFKNPLLGFGQYATSPEGVWSFVDMSMLPAAYKSTNNAFKYAAEKTFNSSNSFIRTGEHGLGIINRENRIHEIEKLYAEELSKPHDKWNMELLQKLRNEHAKLKGALKNNDGGLQTFYRGDRFPEQRDNQYNLNPNSSISNHGVWTTTDRNYAGTYTSDGIDPTSVNENNIKSLYGYGNTHYGPVDGLDSELASDIREYNGSDVIYGHDAPWLGDWRKSKGVEYNFKGSNHLKLTDAVTFDNKGNPIGLSLRDDLKNNDIRYDIASRKTKYGKYDFIPAYDVTDYVKISDDDYANLNKIANGKEKPTISELDLLSKLNPEIDLTELTENEIRELAKKELNTADFFINGSASKINNADNGAIETVRQLRSFYNSKNYRKRADLNGNARTNELVKYLRENLTNTDFVEPINGGTLRKTKNGKWVFRKVRGESQTNILADISEVRVAKEATPYTRMHEYVHASDKGGGLKTLNKNIDSIHPTSEYSAKEPERADYLDNLTEKRARIVPTLEWMNRNGMDINNLSDIDKVVDYVEHMKNLNKTESMRDKLKGISDLLDAFKKEDVKKMMKEVLSTIPFIYLTRDKNH